MASPSPQSSPMPPPQAPSPMGPPQQSPASNPQSSPMGPPQHHAHSPTQVYQGGPPPSQGGPAMSQQQLSPSQQPVYSPHSQQMPPNMGPQRQTQRRFFGYTISGQLFRTWTQRGVKFERSGQASNRV